jgi:hypothetical protein
MVLDDGDKAIMMEISRTIVKEVLTEHVQVCPFGRRQLRDRALLIGACVGSGIGGGGLLFTILEFMSKGT